MSSRVQKLFVRINTARQIEKDLLPGNLEVDGRSFGFVSGENIILDGEKLVEMIYQIKKENEKEREQALP